MYNMAEMATGRGTTGTLTPQVSLLQQLAALVEQAPMGCTADGTKGLLVGSSCK